MICIDLLKLPSRDFHLEPLESGDLDRRPSLLGLDHGAGMSLRIDFSPKDLAGNVSGRRSSRNDHSSRFEVSATRRWRSANTGSRCRLRSHRGSWPLGQAVRTRSARRAHRSASGRWRAGGLSVAPAFRTSGPKCPEPVPWFLGECAGEGWVPSAERRCSLSVEAAIRTSQISATGLPRKRVTWQLDRMVRASGKDGGNRIRKLLGGGAMTQEFLRGRVSSQLTPKAMGTGLHILEAG